MAKEVSITGKNKKGKGLAEYPKLLQTGPHVKGERGVHKAPKVLVNNEEEEKAARKQYNLPAKETAKKGNWS